MCPKAEQKVVNKFGTLSPRQALRHNYINEAHGESDVVHIVCKLDAWTSLEEPPRTQVYCC